MTSVLYDLDEIGAQVHLVDLVVEFGAVPTGRGWGRLRWFRCPGHADATPSFSVEPPTGRWRCWGACDRGGTGPFDFVMWLRNCTFPAAVEWLARRVGVGALPAVAGSTNPTRVSRATSAAGSGLRLSEAPGGAQEPSCAVPPKVDFCRPVGDPDRERQMLDCYLRGRGWTAETAERFGLTVVVDRYGNLRVRHPFVASGRPFSWQDRAVTPTVEPRWLLPGGGTTIPFNFDDIGRAYGMEKLLVCEGPADAITLAQVFPAVPVIGMPGTGSWRRSWTAMVAGLTLVLISDNDAAGRKLRKTLPVMVGTAARVEQAWVPDQWNDVTEWAVGDPEGFKVSCAVSARWSGAAGDEGARR